jgi:hypothetical protein
MMSDRLFGLADLLTTEAEEVKSICSEKVDEDFRESQKGLGQILTALVHKN